MLGIVNNGRQVRILFKAKLEIKCPDKIFRTDLKVADIWTIWSDINKYMSMSLNSEC